MSRSAGGKDTAPGTSRRRRGQPDLRAAPGGGRSWATRTRGHATVTTAGVRAVMLTGGGCGRVTVTTGHRSTSGGAAGSGAADRVTPCWWCTMPSTAVTSARRRSYACGSPCSGRDRRAGRPFTRRLIASRLKCQSRDMSTATSFRTTRKHRLLSYTSGVASCGFHASGDRTQRTRRDRRAARCRRGWRRPPRARSRTTRSCRRRRQHPRSARATVVLSADLAASAALPAASRLVEAAPLAEQRPRSRSSSASQEPGRLVGGQSRRSPDSLLTSRNTWPSLGDARPRTRRRPCCTSGNGCHHRPARRHSRAWRSATRPTTCSWAAWSGSRRTARNRSARTTMITPLHIRRGTAHQRSFRQVMGATRGMAGALQQR